jgi:Asp-tRNA(Asn)/Glu-tRNA(Gln) amidotransferase A subunit family amidase
MEALDLPLLALRELLDARLVSSQELAEQCISRVQAAESLNAFASFSADALRASARSADERLRTGERLPLLGIPLALKDNMDVAGVPCGAGTGALKAHVPRSDAELVRRLGAAGAVLAGKLNMHELAFGITSNNAVTGAVRNPWDPARIPGGSSGGSGAAVAARLVPAAIGTDTGGSVRVPAALCGVVGFRPTVGRVPASGLAPISATRDTAGPLARTVRDCALLDEVLAGAPAGVPSLSLNGLRLGVPRAPFWEDLAPDLREVAEAALATLGRAGAVLVEMELPGVMQADAECSFPVALYEFVRDMGRYLADRAPEISLQQVIAGVGSPDVRGAVGTLLSGGGIPEPVYRQALEARTRLQSLYAAAFAQHRVEALVFPTTPRTAAPIGEDETVELNGKRVPTFGTFIRNTDPGSNASLPGVTLPAGLASGLPVGLALDGPIGSDRHLLAIAAAVEAVMPPAPRPNLPA